MPLDWDVLLDDVSIKTQIAGFQVRESKGAYARELTLFAADPLFYDLFDYTAIPLLRIEIKTKIAATWISQGKFFIERPGIFATPDSIMSPGVWGRSETAVAGPPFAAKVSKTWTQDTTVQDIITEMADLCDLTVTFDIDNFPVFANSYAVDGIYPIDVISDLAGFCGGHVGCTAAGALVIRPEIFHPAAADHTITDDDIADISENIEYPEFGNRIRIGALGAGSGYQVDLEALDDSDCLPADGVARGTLLAFVTDNEGEPVPDNTIATWTIEDGATLDAEHTNTGNYLLTNRKHRAENYYTVNVDYPISDVIGIWAYADGYGQHNFWDGNGSFNGREITVANKFSFCDQMLRIAYITAGCAVNKATAGTTALDVEVSADVEGAKDTIAIYIGNPCACGSNLNAKVNPYGAICFGNLAHILVWATINNAPAAGYPVQLRITSGCGELSSENKTLQTAEIINELSHVNNDITGVSQVETEIIPADVANPQVYLKSDTAKAVDLYASHNGKLIDLTTSQETGQEVVIDYHADGATLVAWRTIDVDKECDSEVTIKMADGTEAGLKEEVNFSAVDCAEPDDIPDYSGDWSDYDPANDDQNSDSGGFEDDGNDADSGAGLLEACDVIILNRVANIDNAVDEDDIDNLRFGTTNPDNCPEEGEDWECTCAELCESEVHYKGGTYDESQTIHEIIIAAGETEGTPAYNEAFEVEKQRQLDACENNCASQRGEVCWCDDLVYDTENSVDTLADSSSGIVYWSGDSAPYTVSVNGSGFYLDAGYSITTLETDDKMVVVYSEDACGACQVTITGECSEVTGVVLSTDGNWVYESDTQKIIDEFKGTPGTPFSGQSSPYWPSFTSTYAASADRIVTQQLKNSLLSFGRLDGSAGCGECANYISCNSWDNNGCLTQDTAWMEDSACSANNCGVCNFISPSVPGGTYTWEMYRLSYDPPTLKEWKC